MELLLPAQVRLLHTTMKMFIILAAITLIALPCCALAERPFLTVTNVFEGKLFTCSLRSEDVESSPKWHPTEDEPPMRPRKAMRLAEDHVRRIVNRTRWGDCSTDVIALHTAGIRDVWFYLVRVQPYRAGSGGYWPMEIIVLMDGTVPKYAERELRPEEKGLRPGKFYILTGTTP